MNKACDLLQKRCQPCEGIGHPLDRKETEELLKNTPGWQIDQAAQGISRQYVMKNFKAAVNFINKIADLAESENHHPDLHLTGYRTLKIDLSTHTLKGLSENDFIMAAKINEIPVELKT